MRSRKTARCARQNKAGAFPPRNLFYGAMQSGCKTQTTADASSIRRALNIERNYIVAVSCRKRTPLSLFYNILSLRR